jgi:hypothetical protein|tara:strand:+ start:288 stop:491 length:204 start_codon:yes stop_codon:yes gene_type:complete
VVVDPQAELIKNVETAPAPEETSNTIPETEEIPGTIHSSDQEIYEDSIYVAGNGGIIVIEKPVRILP